MRGGLIVHLGCGDWRLTAALCRVAGTTSSFDVLNDPEALDGWTRPRRTERGANCGYLVHAIDRDAATVEKAREHIRSLGLYGKVSVECLTTDRLPYTDNLVNLLVAEGLGRLPMDELLRVLAPGGVAYLRKDGKWTTTVKPRPKEIDEWTHALYDATGNAACRDAVVAPPHHIQWVAEPRNARHHERMASVTVVVSAGGRLFYIVDEAPTASILLRPEWFLVARDAFSGVALWKRPISVWEPYLRAFRSGPPELSRRLVAKSGPRRRPHHVASGDRVYVTLGLRAPVSALEAATGRTAATYEGTEGTEEILYQDGVLYLVVGGPATPGVSASATASEKSIMALDAAKGGVLWKNPEGHPLPMSAAVGGGRFFYLDDNAIVGLDARTGREIWRTERNVARRSRVHDVVPTARKRPGWSAPTLVVHGDIVLCADRQATPASNLDESTGKRIAGWLAQGGYPGDLLAYSATTGEKLWSCRCAEGYHAPIDVFVIDGMVWVGQSRARNGPDFTVARDLRTGEIVRRISPHKAFKTTMPHHRCHRNRATCRYIVTGRTGVEFIDLATGEGLRHHWVRGTCQYGVIPCNGLLYAPPHSCACYIEAKLAGFYALAPKRKDARRRRLDRPGDRLERGPAYASAADQESQIANPHDWPTYRHDAARSGCTNVSVPTDLRYIWKARVGGRLTGPVVAQGLALVASVDTHTLHALDANTGERVWRYTAGGRIDSPPSVSRGLAVFGSADGWVYCVRASDGKLAWRFRAAPEARRVVAFGQVESTWPVHGSVLIQDDVVYCAAGRSSYLDNGIYLYRLDLRTGTELSEQRIYSRDPVTGEQPQEPEMFEMPGALPDVLSSDGELVYMRRLALDSRSLERRPSRRHLYSPAGFLNGDWWHRTYWIYGEHFYSGYIGWYFAGRENPAGRLLSVDGSTIYGFAYKPAFYRGSTGRQYHLFAADKDAQPPTGPPDYKRANRDYPPRGPGKFKVRFKWQKDVPLLARAMVLAKDTLFLAGPPERALRSGRHRRGPVKEGAILYAVSAADGKTLGSYKLDFLPVFDGMAAAQESLYVSLENGTLICLGAGQPGKDGRPPRDLVRSVVKSSRAPRGAAREPGLVGHWTFDEGAGAIAKDSSGLGNDADVYGQWVRGEFGTCVFTGGAPGAVTIWDDASLQFGRSDFSMEFWVKVDRFDCRLLGKEDFPRNWWVINVLKDGRAELVLGTGRDRGRSVRPTSRTPLSGEKWTHVAFVCDRDHFEVKCFINGKLDSTTKIPATLTGGLSVEGKDLKIPSVHKPFVGLFDELKLYRRTLTDAEVRASYEREKGKRTSVGYRWTE